MKVKCISNGGFSFIKVDTEYELLRSTRDYYYIVNESGNPKRYGKSYFIPVEEKEKVVKKPAPPKEKPPVRVVACVFPKVGILTFGKEYSIIKETPDHFIVHGDNNADVEVLKTRFKL